MKKMLIAIAVLALLHLAPTFASEPLHIEMAKVSLRSIAEIERMATAQLALQFELRRETITLLTAGDIIFHGPQIKSAYNPATLAYDFTRSFEAVKPIIDATDFAMANFEGTVPGKGYKNPVEFMFQWPDETVNALQYAGFDLLSTANNHSFDGRLAGVDRTIDTIIAQGLIPTGTFKDDSSALRFETVNVKGLRIGVVAIGHLFNGFEYAYDPETFHHKVNNMDEARLAFIIGQMKAANHDVIFAYVHWGNEYFSAQSAHQTEMKNKLWDMGVDIIAGSHPHVVQPDMYKMNGKRLQYVIYSMGNFISNQNRATIDIAGAERTEDGVMMAYTFTKDVLGTVRTEKITPIPTWVHRRLENGQFEYTVYPVQTVAPAGLESFFETSAKRTLLYVKGFRATEAASD